MLEWEKLWLLQYNVGSHRNHRGLVMNLLLRLDKVKNQSVAKLVDLLSLVKY
jgi:hypothetical protein